MKNELFHDGWTCKHLDGPGGGAPVLIPHDAMLAEPRNAGAKCGLNGAWFEGHCYEYAKSFFVPEDARQEHWVLEFEGVQHNAQVFLNGVLVAQRPYGYSNFYADLDANLIYGGENRLRVIADNSDQPNSRWYTGSGLYRPVRLWRGPRARILMNGVRIRTCAIDVPQVEIGIKTNATGTATVSVFDEDTCIFEQTVPCDEQALVTATLPGAGLWSPENPRLYRCRVRFGEDLWEGTFGIRSLEWGREGLLLNGKRIILRGACIHHDNGLLGAATWADAEERRVRLLKENGYNAIRSAHNPCSKALLEACDRQGMLMMDEFVDCWYIHKTQHDYVNLYEQWWQQDLKDMVDKDYNHPCVIMYSTGNEVSETAQKKGIDLTRTMTDYLYSLDPSRPVSCGVNIFFNFLSSMGFGVYSDEKAAKEAKEAEKDPSKKKAAVGSEFFNNLAGLLGDEFMKRGATLPPCDWKTRDAFAAMDIAGYNYGIYRYEHDLKKYPDRLILGSETFCKDASRFYELAKKEPRIIGDFVWAGMDYLGEVGIGSWEYSDYAPKFDNGPGWISAGSGRIDLTGKPLAEAAYTRVAFDLEERPIIAVRPVNHTGDSHSPSAWKMTNAMESWSWTGCEGKPADVEVYARGESVALFLNGEKLGQKKLKHRRTMFRVTYQNGTLEAVSYDRQGKELARNSLTTAGQETRLRLTPEESHVAPGHLAFVRIAYTDGQGKLKPMERHRVRVRVTGGKLLALGHGCPYNPDGYLGADTDTYYGEALAIVLAEGPVTLQAEDGTCQATCSIAE